MVLFVLEEYHSDLAFRFSGMLMPTNEKRIITEA